MRSPFKVWEVLVIYLGKIISTGKVKEFTMPNTDKTAVEIEWNLETPVREDIYDYIVNE